MMGEEGFEGFVLTVTKPYGYVGNGQKTVTTAGTRERLHENMRCMVVAVKALAGNAGIVYLGDDHVSASVGFELSAKEGITLEVDNLNLLWLDAANNGDGVSFLYLH